MSTDRLTSIPAALYAGDTCRLTLTFADYAAPTWALAWSLAGPDVLSVESVDNEAAHDLTLTAAQTAVLGAGAYTYTVRASDGTETLTVQTGTIQVLPDLSTLTAGEAVSFAARTLPIVEAAIAGTLEGEMKMYMIAGRQVMTFTPAELWDLRAKLRAECNRERNGGQHPPVIIGRFAQSVGAWE